MNDDDKLVRTYYGDDGWTHVFRTKDGLEYHISRRKAIEVAYSDKYINVIK